VPRKLWALVVVVFLIVLLAIRSNSTILADDMSYGVLNQRTLGLVVGAPDLAWTRVTGVAESDTEVRITVETLVYPIPLPQSGELPIQHLTVTLSRDLGNRVVEDALGTPIPASR
jgi:hypothetical protein